MIAIQTDPNPADKPRPPIRSIPAVRHPPLGRCTEGYGSLLYRPSSQVCGTKPYKHTVTLACHFCNLDIAPVYFVIARRTKSNLLKMRKQSFLAIAAMSLALLNGTSLRAQPYSNAVVALNPVA